MASITNSKITEDLYIAHLAGKSNGKTIIGYNDCVNACCAQKHPIGNKIRSVMTGLMKSSVLAGLGLLTYPLMNNTMKSSILGSSSEVCKACMIHTKSLAGLIMTVQSISTTCGVFKEVLIGVKSTGVMDPIFQTTS